MGNFIIFSSLLKGLKNSLRSFPVIQSIGIVFLFIGFSFLAGGCSSSSSDDEAVRFIVQEEPENYPTLEDRIEALFDCNAALKLKMHELSLEKEKALAHYQYWQSKIAQAKASGVDSSSVLGLKAKSKTAEKALKKTQLKIDEALHFEASWRLNSWMWLLVGFEFIMLFFILRPVLWYEKYADDSIIVIPVFFPILLINRSF